MGIIDEVKAKIDIVDLVSEDTSVRLKKHGKNWTGFCPFHANTHTPALVVFPDTGTWKCFGSCNDGGSVIDWVMRKNNGFDVTEAVKELAKKAGITISNEGDLKQRLAARMQEDTLKLAMDVFKKWLWEDEAALAYARDRGWSDETIKAGGIIGFSGRATAAQVNEMRGTFSMYGVDLLSPQAVMVLGFNGDVAKWATAHNIDPKSLPDDKIHGLMNIPGLIYGHKFEGTVQYLSRRQLPGFDQTAEGKDWKSFNPYNALAGERKPFFNNLHKYHYAEGREKGERIIIAEGQGDAVAWGQFGVPALALCGSSWQTLVDNGTFERLKAEYEHISFGTDADTPGEKVLTGKKNDFPLSTAFGPMLWVTRMPKGTWTRPDGQEKTIKDTNDLAQWAKDRKINKKWLNVVVRGVLGSAVPIVTLAAEYTGKQQGAFFADALEKVTLPLIMDMPNQARNHYSAALAAGLYPSQSKTEQGSLFRKLVADELKERKSKEKDDGERLQHISTFGQWIPLPEDPTRGWLIDYVYDPASGKAQLAYRNPDGEISTANYLDIDGKRYEPQIDDFVRKGVVVFASALGPLRTTGEMLALHEEHHRRSALLDKSTDYKMFSFYTLFTWIYDCFNELPFLRARGDKDTGKSAIMLRAGYVCNRLCKSTGISSTASLKYAQEAYKGTIFFDEMDVADKFDERIVMLNVRAMKDQAYVWSMRPVQNEDGQTVYEPQAHNVYGPALITMYGDFADPATNSRCITFDLFGKDVDELRAKGIPRRLNAEWFKRAEDLRNMSLHWRLKNWKPNMEIPDELEDSSISTRANQVTVQIKRLVMDDKDALAQVTTAVREMYADEILARAESFPARFLEGIISITENKRFDTLGFLRESEITEYGHAKYIRYPDLAKVVNFLIDEMNSGVVKDVSILAKETEPEHPSDDKEGGKKKKKKDGDGEGVSSKTVGNVLRKDLRLPVTRLGSGYVVIVWSQAQPMEAQDRIAKMRSKFGLDFVKTSASAVSQPVPVVSNLHEEPPPHDDDEMERWAALADNL